MTTLLALDTCTEACSVALLHNNAVLARDEIASRAHTQRILPLVDEVLSEAGLRLNQVDALVFGRGPGSFTGVRIATGIVQGLALGADLPIVPVSNLTAMAQAALAQTGAQQVLAAIDARMQEVYFSQLIFKPCQNFVQNSSLVSTLGMVGEWQARLEEQVVSPSLVLEMLQAEKGFNPNDWQRVGTGWEAYAELASLPRNSEILLPSAQFMLPLALADVAAGRLQDPLTIEPIYLRNNVALKKA